MEGTVKETVYPLRAMEIIEREIRARLAYRGIAADSGDFTWDYGDGVMPLPDQMPLTVSPAGRKSATITFDRTHLETRSDRIDRWSIFRKINHLVQQLTD